MTRSTANRGLALLIILVVAADWLSKLWIVNRLALGESQAVMDGWLYLVHRQNPGVAFSMFADLPDSIRVPVLSGVSLIGIVLFSRVVRSTPDRLAQLAGAAVIAGAVGNFGDRVWTGEVTDFVFLAFFPFVFNLADAAITIGGSVLVLRLFRDDAQPVPVASTG